MSINWHEFLAADIEAGTLTWKIRLRDQFTGNRSWKIWNVRFAGKLAGTVNADGYQRVSLFNKRYLAHRILFEMASGPIPEGHDIDHRDQNKRNNGLSNLRLATRAENLRNTGLPTNNTSGVKGVRWHNRDGKWHAQIQHHGRHIHLGYFTNFDDALAARRAADVKYHGEFTPSIRA